MTPKETAERIVMDYLKQITTSGGMTGIVHKESMGKAKMYSHYVVNKIIEELRVNFQHSYTGIDRLDHWKQVKQNIDNAFEDKG